MEDGYAAFDMQPFMTAMREGTAPDEVSLAKIEQCIADGSMPLKSYYFIHWGASITNRSEI